MLLHDVSRTVEQIDVDASGVVHFSRYASLLESGVLENLDRLGIGLAQLAADGLGFAVAELSMRYRSPARFLDRVVCSTAVERVTGATCLVRGELRRGGEPGDTLLATGSLLLCVVDETSGGAVPLPSDVRRGLRALIEGSAP